MNTLLEALRQAVSADRIQVDAELAPYTTFQIGGPADVLILPRSVKELQAIMHVLHSHQVEPFVLGLGSNVLIQDGGMRGVVLCLKELQEEQHRNGTTIIMSAGYTLKEVSEYAQRESLSGLEFAIGIPGSLGGAVFMNAGAYDGEMDQVVTGVDAVDMQGNLHHYSREELQFAYRHSRFHENHEIIVRVTMELQEGNPDDIQKRMDELTEKRESKQPLEHASAGSTFKRPLGYYAGTLIDQTGLKGLSVGPAEVSVKHAGFVVNRGGATANDVLGVIHEVQKRIHAVHGVQLEPEVRILGEAQERTSSVVTIVRAKEEDIPALSKLCADTFRETFRHDNTEEELQAFFDETYNHNILKSELGHSESETYLAYVEDKLAGYLKVNWGDAQTEYELENAFEVQRLYVLKDYHGQGVGKALFEKALRIAESGDFAWAWLGVWEKNYKAQDFYKSYGFEKFGEHQFIVTPEKADIDWLLKKSLR